MGASYAIKDEIKTYSMWAKKRPLPIGQHGVKIKILLNNVFSNDYDTDVTQIEVNFLQKLTVSSDISCR